MVWQLISISFLHVIFLIWKNIFSLPERSRHPQSPSLICFSFENHCSAHHFFSGLLLCHGDSKYHVTGLIAICLYFCGSLGIVGSLNVRSTMSNSPAVATFLSAEPVSLSTVNNVCWTLVPVEFDSSTKRYVLWSQGPCLLFLLYPNCPFRIVWPTSLPESRTVSARTESSTGWALSNAQCWLVFLMRLGMDWDTDGKRMYCFAAAPLWEELWARSPLWRGPQCQPELLRVSVLCLLS